jgi:hypothetical protein
MFFRNDGLLRGSREDRGTAMFSLVGAKWDLGAFLDLHCGLLDHAEDVRAAAMKALQEIAKRRPEPIALTPLKLLPYFLFSFTVASGMRVDTFEFLVDLDTPEAHDAIVQILLWAQRNEDFSDFVRVLRRADKLELLRRLEPAKLSKAKTAILRSALDPAGHHPC